VPRPRSSPTSARVPVRRRNLVWLVFGWPTFRDLIPNWKHHARSVLAQSGAAADEHPADPRFTEIIDDLPANVEDFPSWWARHDIGTYGWPSSTSTIHARPDDRLPGQTGRYRRPRPAPGHPLPHDRATTEQLPYLLTQSPAGSSAGLLG